MIYVSMALVKELRARTQAKLDDCRRALLETGEDLDAAAEYLMRKGLVDSIRRSGAEATEGVVLAIVSEIPTSGAIVEINTQTDFAARSSEFLAFANTYVRALLTKGPFESLEDARSALVARMGENIVVRRWQFVTRIEGEVVSYIHPGNKIAVLVEAEQASPVLQDVAMQVAAMNPLFLDPARVLMAAASARKELILAQLVEEGKLQTADWALVVGTKWERVIEGKLAKWYKEVCLLEQPSILEPKKNVRQVLQAAGVTPEKVSFIRYALGEGIEKTDKSDFASEVAALTQS